MISVTLLSHVDRPLIRIWVSLAILNFTNSLITLACIHEYQYLRALVAKLEEIKKTQHLSLQELKNSLDQEIHHSQQSRNEVTRNSQLLHDIQSQDEDLFIKLYKKRSSMTKIYAQLDELKKVKKILYRTSHSDTVNEELITREKFLQLEQQIKNKGIAFQTKTLTAMKQLIAKLTQTKQKIAHINRRIEYYENLELVDHQRLELEIKKEEREDNIDKLIPWLNPTVPWDLTIEIQMINLQLKKGVSVDTSIFEIIQQRGRLSDLCDSSVNKKKIEKPTFVIQEISITLHVMTTPFGTGTFRSCYYAIDNNGTRYAVKHFKNTNADDRICSTRTSHAYFISGLFAQVFTKELNAVGYWDTKISFVPVKINFTFIEFFLFLKK